MITLTSLFVTLFLVLVVLWCWLHWKHHRLISAANKMESVFFFRFPILGHIPYTILGTDKMTMLGLRSAAELLKKGTTIASFWIGPYPVPIVVGAENVQKVLNSSYTSEKGVEMKYFDYFLGSGLLNAPGYIWKVKRRHINPLFHPHNLELLMPTFNRNSEELVSVLSRHVGGGEFEVADHVMDTALKTVCQLIFGPDIEFDVTCPRFQGLKRIIERILKIVANRTSRAWLRFDAIFQFLYKSEIEEINKVFYEFTETPLKIAKKEREQRLENNHIDYKRENEENNIINSKSKGLLNLLDVHSVLEQKFPQFDESDLQHEMVTLYVTGTDTIGIAVSSCLLALGHYKEIQERLFKEIVDVCPDGDVTLANIQELSYLDQVYKETLRWAVIVVLVARKTTEDLKLGDVIIPEGYTVMVGIGADKLNPKIFPNPNIFDPERFTQENIAQREKYSFIPFSGGPRNCIGQNYTNMLMKVILVHILRRYKILTNMDVHNLKKKLFVSMKNTDGYKIILEKR